MLVIILDRGGERKGRSDPWAAGRFRLVFIANTFPTIRKYRSNFLFPKYFKSFHRSFRFSHLSPLPSLSPPPATVVRRPRSCHPDCRRGPRPRWPAPDHPDRSPYWDANRDGEGGRGETRRSALHTIPSHAVGCRDRADPNHQRRCVSASSRPRHSPTLSPSLSPLFHGGRAEKEEG